MLEVAGARSRHWARARLTVWEVLVALGLPRVVGAWLVGLGWAAAHARVIDDVGWVRPLGLRCVTFVLLEMVALVRYGDALDWTSAGAAAYVLVLAGIAVTATWILALGRRADVTAGDEGAPARTR